MQTETTVTATNTAENTVINIEGSIRGFIASIENVAPHDFVQEIGCEWTSIADDFWFMPEEIDALANCCALLGVPYNGATFEVYQSGQSLKVLTPRILSNGKTSGIQWGKDFYPLADETPLPQLRSMRHPNFCYRFPANQFQLGISLDINHNSPADEARVDRVFSDAETYGDLKAILARNLEVLKGDTLFALTMFRIAKLEHVKTEDKDFYIAEIHTSADGDMAKIFLSGSADVAVGDGFKVNVETRTLHNTRTGIDLETAGFIKLHDLPIGVYKVVKIAPKTGEFGGYNLTIPGQGIANSNGKIEKWLVVLGDEGQCITAQNPALLEILSVKTLKNGNKQTDLLIRLEQFPVSDRLARLKARVKSAAVENVNVELPWKADPAVEPEAIVEPESEVVKPVSDETVKATKAKKAAKVQVVEQVDLMPKTADDDFGDWK